MAPSYRLYRLEKGSIGALARTKLSSRVRSAKKLQRAIVLKRFRVFFRPLSMPFIALLFSQVAHAQGTMDFSGATTLMDTFRTFAMYAGAVICLGGLIFAGIRMMSGRFQDAIPGLFGALFGAGVLGWGAGWIGYTEDYLKASSLRREQIKEEMERRGVSGPEAAELAARSTRERKHILSPAEVLAAHREVAKSFGNQPARIVAEARERGRGLERQSNRYGLAREAVSYARASLFEREAVVDERLLLRDALRRGMGETTYQDIRTEFERRRDAGAFLAVEARKYDSGHRFTTAETIAAERENIVRVLDGRNAVEPMMTAELAQRHAQSRDFLNNAQRRVIEEVLNSPDRIHGLQGRAGSGKTTALLSIREGAEQSGYLVEGFAPTSRAAVQLREAGIPSSTLQSFLTRRSIGADEPLERHLYMVDESSLVSTGQMRDLLRKLESNDRVLLIGDTRQHQGVEAGLPFEQMQKAGMRTSELDIIMRQKDPGLLKAVERLSRGETQEGMSLLQSQGRITEFKDRRERIVAIAEDYAMSPYGTIVISPDNRSRQEINEAVRSALVSQGLVSPESHPVQVLNHRSEMTGADRTWAARYSPGDILQYSVGSRSQRIERGSYAEVLKVDAHANLLSVQLGNGDLVTYDPRRLRGVNVFQEQTREFSAGDRVQFTSQLKAFGVANRDMGTIERIHSGRMTIRFDSRGRRSIDIDFSEAAHLDHGYAVTSHSSQGLTAARVIAHFDLDAPRSLINSRLAYVAISRASRDARVYTNDSSILARQLSADVSKSSVIGNSVQRKPQENVTFRLLLGQDRGR